MNKSVRLNILGNNSDAKLKFAEMDAEADRWKEEHPELVLGIDTALTNEKLAIVRADLRATAKAAVAAGEESSAGIAAIGDEAEVVGDKAVVAGGKTAGAFGEKLWGATKFAILGVGAALGYGVIKAVGFDKSIEMLHTQAGVAQGKLAFLGAGVLKLAGQVGEDPDSLSESLYHVESAFGSLGITGPKALSLVKIAAEGAKTGNADLVDVTNALGAAIASGIPGVQNYHQAMGALNSIVGAGDMKMSDLAKAFGTGMVATVKGFGLSLNDVGAALATFGDNNIRGAAGATALRMTVMALAAPAKAGQTQLAAWGVTAGNLGKDMRNGGLMPALEHLHQLFIKNGVTAKQQGDVITNMFGKKAGTGINILMDQLERMKSKYGAISKGAKDFGSDWSATTKTASQQFDDLKDGADALVISLGTKLLPAALAVTHWLTGFVNGLEHGSAQARTIAAVIGTVLAGVALQKLASGINGVVGSFESMWKMGGKAVGFIGSMIGKLGLFKAAQIEATAATEAETAATVELDGAMDSNPIGLIVLAIAGLVIGFKLLWDHCSAFRNFWKAAWHDIGAIISAVWGWIKQNWPYLLGMLIGPVGLVVVFIIKHWHDIYEATVSILGDVLHFFERLPGNILHALGDLGHILWDAGSSIIHGLLSGIENQLGPLLGFVEGIGKKITGVFKSVMGIFSPSRVFTYLGSMIVQGLAIGLGKSQPAVDSAHKLADDIVAGFRSGHISASKESWVAKFVSGDNKRLRDLKGERDKILKEIAAAKQFETSIRQGALADADLTNIQPAKGKVTGHEIVVGEEAELRKIERFDHALKKLGELGLNKQMLQEIWAKGVDDGLPYAEALLNGPASRIGALNSVERKLQRAAGALGGTAANEMYDAGKQSGKGFLSGLEGQQKAIERLMEKIARSMVSTLRKELGIASPSKVGHWHGMQWGQGIANGIMAAFGIVKDASAHLAKAAIAGVGGFKVGGSSGLVTGLESSIRALTVQLAKTTAAMTAAVNGHGGAIGSGRGGGDTYNVNFNGLVAGNPDSIAKEIQTMLLDLKRHRGGGDLGFG